jgi:peptide/nickel transport system ATP-binding protein
VTAPASNAVEPELTDPLLSVRGLSVALPAAQMPALAVNDVAFDLHAGRTLALVGESGCGKTMTCLAIMGLLPARAQVSGQVRFRGRDLLSLSERQLETVRGREIAMVFQDAQGALNPVRSIGAQIVEVLVRHRGMTASCARAETRRLFELVQMTAAARRLDQYPHELSGGMCQRAMIAMAIATEPHLLLADEPTTALDVTVQAQILGLLQTIQRDLGMAQIIVTHDFGIVAQVAQTVGVMYAGRIVELAPVGELLARPKHPYTQALLGALPSRAETGRRLVTIPGLVPRLTERVRGCSFRSRCDKALPICGVDAPPLSATGQGKAACHLLALQGVGA